MPSKALLLSVFIIISNIVSGINYYVSSDGNDSSDGLSESTAWKTLSKLNSVGSTFSAGDRILLRRGDVFYGSLIISSSGAEANPIVFGAYGSGENPVITGFKTLSSWTYVKPGIYRSPLSTSSPVNMVSLNGSPQTLGRYPNTGYLIFESHYSNRSITDNELSASPDWSGAELVLKKNPYSLFRNKITNHSGNTIYYTANFSGEPTNGYGYFIQNNLNTLDSFGEWYHDGTYLYVFFGDKSPDSYTVQASTINRLITVYGQNNLIIENVSFIGANSEAIAASNFNNLIVRHCSFNYSGKFAITYIDNIYNSQYFTIDNCHINNTNDCAINLNGNIKNCIITNNTILNSGLKPGMGSGFYGGIYCIGSNGHFEYNHIENVGRNALWFQGEGSLVKNNFINNFCMIMDDAGAIYLCDYASTLNKKIIGNIVLNGYGNREGIPNTWPETEGIYLDTRSKNVEVIGNTVANCGDAGIKLHDASDIVIKGNTCYNNYRQSMFHQQSYDYPIKNLTIQENIFFSKQPDQVSLFFKSVQENIKSFATLDNNCYTRPLAEDNLIYTYTPKTGSKFRTLEEWKAYTLQDVNSYKTQVPVTDASDIRFYYNAGKTNKVITLDVPMLDVKGTRYKSSITLLPYTSVILIVDPTNDGTDKLGQTAVFSSVSVQNNRRATPLTFSESALIESITVYHEGGTGNLLYGVYSDESGNPSSLLGLTSVTPVNETAGWQTVSLTDDVMVNSGQTVWLSWVFEKNPGVRYTSGTPGRAQSTSTWSDGMPATFGPATYSDYIYSVYCTYNYDFEVIDSLSLGNKKVYKSVSVQNNRRAMPLTFSEPVMIESITVYHEGGTGNLLYGIYSDESGNPSSLLGLTSVTPVNETSGWQTVSLTDDVMVNSGQTVWLSWVFEKNPGVRYTSGTPGRAQSTSTWSDGMPATFGSATYSDYIYSVYCTYNYDFEVIDSLSLGNKKVYKSVSVQNNRRAMPLTFSEPVMIESITVYHEGGTGNLLYGIYSDESGNPSSLLGVTSVTPVNEISGWQTVSLTDDVMVNSGQTVWLSWVFEKNPGVRYTSGTPGRAQSTSTWSDGMPATFGPATYSDYIYSVYCTYNYDFEVIDSLSLGNKKVYKSVSVQNNRRAMPLTFSEPAMIESITVYHEGGTGNLLYGVYSDESGNPSSLLGLTSVTPVNETAGWQTVSLTNDVMVNSGQTVWLSWVFEKNPGVRYTSGTPGRAQSTSTWSDGMPATFGPATYSDYIYSVYCTYNYDFEVIDSLSLGNKKVYKSVSVQNNRRAMPLTFSEPVMIESITVYHEGGTGNLLYGIYSDESGNPSSLLGVTSVTPVNETSGWQTVSLTNDVMVNSGQTVWLSWVFEKNPGVRYTSGTPGRAQSTSTWSDGMPATFGPATYSDYIYSVYCTYNYDFEVIDSLSLGNKKVYKSVSVQNNRRAMPLTFSEPVMIESITVYHEGGTGNLLYGIYSDESGNPSSLLGVTSVTPVNETSGWQTVSLTDDVMVNSGQTVWLSWVFEKNPGVRYTSGTPGRAQSTSTWSDGMPATFGPATYSDYIYSVYCTYNYDFEVIDSLSLGNKKVYKSVSVQNNRRAMPLTFSEPVMIESITVYHEGGTGNLLFGVYSDESGNPSSLLGLTSVTPVNETSGWQTVSLTNDVMVNSGQTVWLSWVFEKNPGVRYTSGTPGRAQSTSTWSDGMPATFGPATYSDYIYSVYCTYNNNIEVFDNLTLGNKEIYNSVSVQNNRRAMPLTFSEPAMIESITVYHEGGTGNLLYGVYSDESGNPSTLLGLTSVTPVNETAGWQTVSLPGSGVTVTEGQTVWLSWVFETNPGVRYTSGTPGRAQSTSTWSDGMPTTFGPATYSDYIYSVYCTYNYNFEVIDSLSLGNKKVYKSVSVQNNRRAMPLTFSEPVMIESITVYHEGGTGNLLYGVYSDESGNPSSLLGVTSVTPVNETSGWQTVSLTDDVMVNSGQTVWLSWVFEKNPGVRYTSGTPGRAQSTSTWSDGMPTTFGPATYSDYIYSVYCTYNYNFEVIDSLSLGNKKVYKSVSVQNNRRAMPLTFSEPAMIESITVYHEGGTGNLLYGVYSDESGNPSSLLGVTSVTPVNETAGWQTVSLTDDVMVNSGQTVWLSWVFETNPGVRYTSGTPGRAQSTSTWSDGMPTTFGPATYSDYIYSVYCTYNYNFEVIDSLSLGNKKVYKSVSVQNNRRAMPLTFSEPVMIESITVYHEGGTGNLLYGVYSDESGNPSSLLGVTSVTPVNETAGWQTVSLTDDVMVNSGQTVWLSWVFEKNPGVRYTSGTPGRAQSTSTWSDGMPTTFGPATYSDYIYSVYCTYNYNFEVIDSLSLGNKKVYKSVSVQNNRRAMPLTFSEPVMIESITVYHEGGTGNLLYGVYSDESGNPSSLLGVTSVTPVNETSGWQTVSLTDDVMVNSGQTVWLSWVFEKNPGVRYTSGTPGRAQSTSTWSDGMPTTFGPATYSDYIYSVYCTYNYNFEVIDSLSLGNKKVYKSVSVQNNRRAMPLTFSEPVMIESITVYHEGGTGNLLYGVYSDESGNPSSLLGVTSVTPVNETSGWQTVSLTDDVMVNSGQTVWLSWVFEKNPGVRYTSGTPGRAQSTSTWSDGMPTTFGPATYSDYIYSVYCTYNYNFEVIDSLSLGNKKVYKSVSVQNNRRAMPLTFSEPAMIESITVYHEGGTGNLLYGVYSDESGNPSSLLGVTSVTPVNETAGWQTVSLTDDVMVNSGQTVWLSWVFEKNPGVRYTSGTPGRAQSTSTWSDGMPTTFGPATYSDYIYSVYCTYNNNIEVIDNLTLGNKEIYNSVSVQNNRRAMPLTFSEPVMIESITVYHEGGTGNLLYGVYSDESGNPSSLLGLTSVTPVNETSGWQTVSLTDDVMVNSGQTVWLSWVFEKNPGVRYTSGTPGRAQSTSTWSDGMPATFGPATYSDYIYSVYCTYNNNIEVIDNLTLGNKEIYNSVSVQNNRRAMPLTFSEPAMIESITVYHEGGTGNLLFGVYSDESGNPSSLLGLTSVTPVNETAGWQTVSLPGSGVTVTEGQTVWLSWVFETNPGVRYTSGTPGRAQSTSTWSDGMPTTFGPATYSDYIYSVYCTYWSAINNGPKSIESEETKESYYFDDDKPVVELIQEAFEKVVVYPNPTRGNLTVSWNNYSKDRILMVIYNFNGVPFKKEYIGPGINEIHLDLSDVNPGMYIIELRDETTGLLINRSKIIKR